MSTVLVTGAAGFIGSHTCERLLAMGRNVVGVDSFTDYYSRDIKEKNLSTFDGNPRFTLHELDLADVTTAGALDLLDGVDTVIHLAAQPGVRGSWGHQFGTYLRNNVQVTQTLLEASKAADITAFVYASSSSVYGDTDVLPMREDAICRPYSPYGVTKLAGENLCHLYHRNFGVPTVSLRFFTVYGPRQRPDMAFHKFCKAIVDGSPIQVFGDGAQTRDFTFVSDIVSGIVSAESAPPGTIANLGGGSRVTVLQTLEALFEVAGVRVPIDLVNTSPGDVRDTSADLAAAKRAIDYAPQVPLPQGLAEEFRWYVSQVDRRGRACG